MSLTRTHTYWKVFLSMVTRIVSSMVNLPSLSVFGNLLPFPGFFSFSANFRSDTSLVSLFLSGLLGRLPCIFNAPALLLLRAFKILEMISGE